MKGERLGAVRVGDGTYARELQQRAIQEGMTVMVEKTIEGNIRYHKIINLSNPRDTGMTRFYQRWKLKGEVERAVIAGETVIMSLYRFNYEI
jgi:hypothetical protein